MRDHAKKPLKGVFLGILLCLVLCLSFVVVNYIPSYLYINIDPPVFDEGDFGWNKNISMVWRSTLFDANYMWQRKATVKIDDTAGSITADNFETYFDTELKKKGWVRSHWASCREILIEYPLLEYVDGSEWWGYQRDTYIWEYDSPMDDFICVAVWPSDDHKYFFVRMATVRPSLYVKIITFIFQ